MRNVHVDGHFQAFGGMQNDIQAVICSDQEFLNFRNGHQAKVFYNSGKTTVADISASLPGSDGRYMLAFNNNFSLLSGKTVSGEITLGYDTVWGNEVFVPP
jgi:hypothetical protein